MKLVAEVLDHAPADWTQAERLFVSVLAEQARDSTRKAWPGSALLSRRTGLLADSVTRLCHRLAAKGFELRVTVKVTDKGRQIFAHHGHRAEYVIPRLCPLVEHDPETCFPSKKDRTVVRSSSEGSPDDGPVIEEESPDSGPVFKDVETDGGPVFDPRSPDGGPERPDGGPVLPSVTPQTSNPQTSAATNSTIVSPRWAAVDANTTPKTVNIPKAAAGRPSALFSVAGLKLTEREEVIQTWMRLNNYRDITDEDVRAVAALAKVAFEGKTSVAFYRGVAGPNGSGFGTFYEEILRDRAKAAAERIAELERTTPECQHGTSAGGEPHPVTGELLCPLCRRGVQAPDEVEVGHNHPDVTAAITAFGVACEIQPHALEIVTFAQHAELLRREGIAADQLLRLATTAGASGTTLLAALQEASHASR